MQIVLHVALQRTLSFSWIMDIVWKINVDMFYYFTAIEVWFYFMCQDLSWDVIFIAKMLQAQGFCLSHWYSAASLVQSSPLVIWTIK